MYSTVKPVSRVSVENKSPTASLPIVGDLSVVLGFAATSSYVCSLLQCVTVCGGVLRCVAVCCGVLRVLPVCCSRRDLFFVAMCCSVVHCVAVCCSVLQ